MSFHLNVASSPADFLKSVKLDRISSIYPQTVDFFCGGGWNRSMRKVLLL